MAGKKINVKHRLDDIAENVKAGLTPFQRATVDYVSSLYEKDIKRVLVADEVGLGKTLVARGVIAEIARLRKKEHDDLVKVAYVCANGAIASQNIERLRIDADIKLADPHSSRLSMQHLALAEECLDKDLSNRYVEIVPLTPQTSFDLDNAFGMQTERALMLAVLSLDPAFANSPKLKRKLKELLWCKASNSVKKNWERDCADYKEKVNQIVKQKIALDKKGKQTYPFEIISKVKEELLDDVQRDSDNFKHTPVTFDEIVDCLNERGMPDRVYCRDIIVSLRRAFSKASIAFMEPDFVIMDEFQHFKNLIATDDSEASLLAERFFSDKARILLLSATPFRMYSTKEEAFDGTFGDSYKEFIDLIDFLSDKDRERFNDFVQLWTDYSYELAAALSDEEAVVRCRQKKNLAQNSAATFISRTERTSTGELGSISDNSAHIEAIEINAGDIKSFYSARRLMRAAGVSEELMYTDFSKSCPYPLSFMRDYIAKKNLDRSAQRNWGAIEKVALRERKQLWINRNDVRLYKRLKIDNARYRQLEKDLFGGVPANQLLWVPASMPYYFYCI